jgi:hypothetical protein
MRCSAILPRQLRCYALFCDLAKAVTICTGDVDDNTLAKAVAIMLRLCCDYAAIMLRLCRDDAAMMPR